MSATRTLTGCALRSPSNDALPASVPRYQLRARSAPRLVHRALWKTAVTFRSTYPQLLWKTSIRLPVERPEASTVVGCAFVQQCSRSGRLARYDKVANAQLHDLVALVKCGRPHLDDALLRPRL